MKRNNQIAYEKRVCAHPLLDARLQFLRDADAPFMIFPRRSLILLILDDQGTITCGWPDSLVLEFYRNLRESMENAGIPIAWNKSSAPASLAKHEMPFIGHIISMEQNEILPSPEKCKKISVATCSMMAGTIYVYD